MPYRSLPRILAPLLALMTLSSFGAAQVLDATGVIYVFTPQLIGSSPAYAVIPVATDQVRADVPPTVSIPTAFGLLRNGKAATYGNTSIRLTDGDLRDGQVVVTVDPSRAQYFLIIAAETVYTFTALGVDRVVFPGFDDDGMTRADIPYAAYSYRVPMWQALPPAHVHGAEIVLPDGSALSSTDFYDRLDRSDRALTAQILEYLRSELPLEVFGALAALQQVEVPDYEAAVIPLLTHADPAVREAGLMAISSSTNSDAWDAVVRMMQDDAEPGLRLHAAGALAQSPLLPYRYWEIVFRGNDGEAPARLGAIAELGALDDDRAEAQLVAWLADPLLAIGQGAVEALQFRGAWSALEEAMNSSALASGVRLAAASALAESASGPSRLAGLRFRVLNLTGDPAVGALEAIHGLTSPDPRTTLEEMLAHPDRSVAIRAAALLGERRDSRSLEALSRAFSGDEVDPDLRAAVEEAAFEVMGALELDDVQRYATGRDLFLKRSAFRALAARVQAGQGGEEIFEMLQTGLTSTEPVIRGGSAIALSSYGTGEALELILGLVNDESPQVQGDVARALGGFPGETFAPPVNTALSTYLTSGEPEVVAGALDSIGRLGQTQLLSFALEKVEHPDPRVRASAMRASALLVDAERPRPVINAIAGRLNDEFLGNRILAAQLLGGFNNDLSVLSISQVLNEPIPELRYAAIEALGRSQNAGAAGSLLALLEDPDREIRLASLRALRVLCLRSIVPELQTYLGREQDSVTVDAERELIEFLNAEGR